MLTWMVAGCAAVTTRYYVSPVGAERITPATMDDRVSAIMVLECPRLLGNRDSAHGAISVALAVDSTGLVHRASMRRGSPSASFDDVLGALAAQLQLRPHPRPLLDPPPDRRLDVFYWCSRSTADVVIQVDST